MGLERKGRVRGRETERRERDRDSNIESENVIERGMGVQGHKHKYHCNIAVIIKPVMTTHRKGKILPLPYHVTLGFMVVRMKYFDGKMSPIA